MKSDLYAPIHFPPPQKFVTKKKTKILFSVKLAPPAPKKIKIKETL